MPGTPRVSRFRWISRPASRLVCEPVLLRRVICHLPFAILPLRDPTCRESHRPPWRCISSRTLAEMSCRTLCLRLSALPYQYQHQHQQALQTLVFMIFMIVAASLNGWLAAAPNVPPLATASSSGWKVKSIFHAVRAPLSACLCNCCVPPIHPDCSPRPEIFNLD